MNFDFQVFKKFGFIGEIFNHNQLELNWIAYIFCLILAFFCHACAYYYCSKKDDSYYHYNDRHVKFCMIFALPVFCMTGYIGALFYGFLALGCGTPYGRCPDPVVVEESKKKPMRYNGVSWI